MAALSGKKTPTHPQKWSVGPRKWLADLSSSSHHIFLTKQPYVGDECSQVGWTKVTRARCQVPSCVGPPYSWKGAVGRSSRPFGRRDDVIVIT